MPRQSLELFLKQVHYMYICICIFIFVCLNICIYVFKLLNTFKSMYT
jgi:hypothetical protein